MYYVQLDVCHYRWQEEKAQWKYGRCCDLRLMFREMVRGVHVERQRQKGAACVRARACVEWCVHVL